MAKRARWAAGAMAAGIAVTAAVEPPLPMARELSWRAKVHPRVLAARGDEEQEILVVLRERADLSEARDLPTRLEKTRYVFERLTEVAKRSQAPLVAELEASGTEHQSFWIANMIRMRARPESVETLARRGDVARIESDAPLRQRLPLPEELSPRTGLSPETAQAAGPEANLDRINAPAVWAAGVTGQGVVIAGADTGYSWTHPALKAKYRGWNGTTADHNYNWHDAIHDAAPGNACGSNAPAPCDDDSHGTHTMGIAVGDGGAGNQIGVAPGARWIGCRNMDEGVGTPARYTECFQWFLAPTNSAGTNPDPSKSPDIINNSWDCPPSEGCTNPDTLKDIIENVRAAGIVVVVAGGNDGPACSSMDVPETFEASLDVGATDASDAVASFSSRGPGQNGSIKPQVVAPGVSIRSCVPGTGYTTMTGTSMAAPHAAGVAALLISAAPSLSGNPTGIEVLLQQSAVPKTTTNTCGGIPAGAVPNNTAGWGRIDALAAYNLAVAPNSPPTVELSSPADGAVIPAFAAVALDTDVSDDGLVARVDFFAGSQRIATDMTAPFAFDWVLPPSGTHVLTAVATDDQGASTTSAAISITVQPSGSLLPPPWTHEDVGAVGVPGDAGYSAGTFSVAGSGGGIGGTSDQFHFAFQQVSGDVEIVARMAGMDNEIAGSKGGIMIRESLAPNSANFALVLTGAGRYQFQRRVSPGALISYVSGTQAAPAWLKLVRAGDTFTAFRSSNGVAWTSLGSYVVALSEDMHVGLAMSSANNSAAAIGTFDSVSVTGSVANSPPGVVITSPQDGAAFADPASVTIQADASDPGGAVARVDFFDGASLLGTDTSPPYAFTWPAPPAGAHVLTARATDDLGATATSSAVDVTVSYSAGGALPAPWVDADVGAVGIAGDAGHSAGTFSVSASGGGIGGTSDQFHYVSQAASGGLQIVARVTGVQGSSPGARGGIMVRQSLAPDAVYVALLVTGAGRWMFQRRTSAGAKIVSTSGTQAAPVWLKLVRSGNTFTAYRSSNGTAWTSLGSASVSINGGVTIGLAATSGDNSVLGLSTFDNVAASP